MKFTYKRNVYDFDGIKVLGRKVFLAEDDMVPVGRFKNTFFPADEEAREWWRKAFGSEKTATEVMLESQPQFTYWCECPVCGKKGAIETYVTTIILGNTCSCQTLPILKHRRVS